MRVWTAATRALHILTSYTGDSSTKYRQSVLALFSDIPASPLALGVPPDLSENGRPPLGVYLFFVYFRRGEFIRTE